MATAYDGSIRINTKIDGKEARNELVSLTKSLKSFAAAMGLAFGVAGIVNFVKSSVAAANELSNAMLGLQSIAEGSGKSFDHAKAFIEDFISDGLVPAANATTAYKNLLSRGYNTEEIEKVMLALKDAAAFGRQASYSIGDAVQTATEGLKNENSILVDNAGVTKNVAKMWDEYAKSIGTTAASLTQEQKIQAEVNGILNETRFQTGDAAKLVNTYSGQVSLLSFQFTTLKTTLGGAFIQVLTPIIRMLNILIERLNAAAKVFASFISSITGNSQKVTTATTGAAAAVDTLTDSTEAGTEAAKTSGKAAKEASGDLASFDQLNVLSSSAAEASGTSGTSPATDTTAVDVATVTESATEATDAAADEMKARMLEYFSLYQDQINRVKDGWNSIKTVAVGIFDAIADQSAGLNIGGAAFEAVLSFLYAVEAAAYLIIGVVGKLFVALNVPAIVESGLKLLSALFETIGDIITALTPGIMAFVDKALVPIAQWIGGKIKDALDFFAEQLTKVGDWFTDHEEQFTIILGFLGEIAAAIWKIIEPILDAAWDYAKAVISTLIDLILGIIGVILDLIVWVIDLPNKFSSAWASIRAAWAVVASWFDTNVVQPLAAFFSGLWLNITTAASNAWTLIMGIWYAVAAWFDVNVVQPVAGFFTGLWTGIETGASTLWAGIVSVWKSVAAWFSGYVISPIASAFNTLRSNVASIWGGIWSDIKSFLQKILNGVGGLINGAIDLINSFIGKLNSMNIDLPDALGGGNIGFNIKTLKTVKIPTLAAGAVIPPNREFMAILGDQKRGVNIESPLDTIIQAVKTALAEMGGTGGGDITITMPVYLDNEKIYEGQQKVIRRRGASLVKG